MELGSLREVLKQKKFWMASFLVAWAAGLQCHMMWIQKQEAFKDKFGDTDIADKDDDKTTEDLHTLR
ncbi:hypothetical protein ZOSMA_127G00330 [Zostera marina]|uniref:Uncharacterized protein n=1 Tax=Zostera marina TaxID=29655 RepID=A0A0K9Q1V5_ZOSMR|nr:hypothetical protein ZOSMA_127G00330 [Zostera marina]